MSKLSKEKKEKKEEKEKNMSKLSKEEKKVRDIAETVNALAEFGYYNCTKCNAQERPKGVMEYSHKTAGVLIVTDDIGFRELKKSASSRR
jgi:hypothetical protein